MLSQNNKTMYTEEKLIKIFKEQKYRLNLGDMFLIIILITLCIFWVDRLAFYSFSSFYPQGYEKKFLSNLMFAKAHLMPFFVYIPFC